MKYLGFILILLGGVGYAYGFDIVRDGKPTAVIVIPDEPVEVVKRAAEEFRYYVKEASDATLEIANESTVAETTKGRIYLGACRATAAEDIALDHLSRNGFIQKTVGSSLFLAGRDTAYPWRAYDSPAETGTLLAVYSFLDRQLGVRWLWPGKLGEVVPRVSTIRIDSLDQTITLPLKSSRFHPSYRSPIDGWSSEQARKRFAEDESLWEQRHCFSWDSDIRSQHSFESYWGRFNKIHPEIFNLLPDGTRRPDPYHVCQGDGGYVAMCVSEPNFWKQIVADWKANRANQSPYIHLGENDTAGSCVCPQCLSWDVPSSEVSIPWDQRLDYAKKAFSEKDPRWNRYLGSISDRYARYYMEVLKLAQQTDPDAVVEGFAYANYSKPPIQTKLCENVVIHFVGTLMYPWTEEKVQAVMSEWNGWANTGAKMVLRPNFMLDGHCMPIFFAKKYGAFFSHCLQKGLIGTEFDSNTGQYAVQGPNLYVMARMHYVTDKSVDEILEEYYDAFAPANEEVREYFTLWERVSDAATDDMCKASRVGALGAEVSGWNRFFLAAGNIFTPEVIAQGKAILERAEKTAHAQPLALARIEFLKKGLINADLTLAAQQAYEQYQKDNDLVHFAKVVCELDEYRASIEKDNVANMAYLAWAENAVWSRSLLTFSLQSGRILPDSWKFMWDLNDQGVSKQWFDSDFDDSQWFDIRVDSSWEEQQVGRQWEQEHGKQYDGMAWYRNEFTMLPSEFDKKILLAFGAVDEACTVWVNGRLVLDRPYPYQGDAESWQKAFDVDITQSIDFDRVNSVVIRVQDSSGAGGIWRPVKLIASEK